MKRVGPLVLVCFVSGCMPVHEVPLGSDLVAVPEGGAASDAAVADAEPMDARSGDQDGADATPPDGGRIPPEPDDDDDDREERSRSAVPVLPDAALASEDASAPDAQRGDGGAADSATRDDDDRGDAGKRRDDDDRP